MVSAVKKLISRLENAPLDFPRWALLFFTITYTRNLLEGMLESGNTVGISADPFQSFQSFFLLFNFEWAALFAVVAAILVIFSGKPASSVLKITLIFYTIILAAPVLDFFVYYPKGSKIEYVFTVDGYKDALIYFFVPFKEITATAGVRMEVFVSCALAFLYVLLSSGRPVKAALASVFIYFFAVSSMCFPVFILMPLLPFQPEPDAFINSFFNSPFLSLSPTARLSAMISPVLFTALPLLLFLYGKKHLVSFARASFLSPGAVVFPSMLMTGFFYSSGMRPIDASASFFPAYVFLAASAALLLHFASVLSWRGHDSLISSHKKFPHTPVLSAIAFICLILSLSLSFHAFMAYLAALLIILCGALLLPGSGHKLLITLVLMPFSLFFVMLAGSALVLGAHAPCLAGPGMLKLFLPVYAAGVIYRIWVVSAKGMLLCAAAVATAYFAAAWGTSSGAVIFAASCCVASIALIAAKRTGAIFTLSALFLLFSGFFRA